MASFLLFTVFACRYQDDDDECADGERRCDGTTEYVCEWRANSCSRECWSDDSGYKWTPKGSCGGQPTLPDPRCEGRERYCEDLVAIICAAGFAVGRDNGDVRLQVDGSAFPAVLHVGDRLAYRSIRESSCGSADVTESTKLSSEQPDVVEVFDFAIIARAPGRARLLTGTNEIAAELVVVP